jgi:DNA (cytosine-5)-methyltransferase 1
MIELFSGIGAQERALRQFGLPYEVKHTCDCDANAVLSYAAMRRDLEKEMETFEFPSQDKMIEELQAKNLGYDFPNEKHTITAKTPLKKLKQYYIADKLSRNLGDISKVERLPYAHLVTYSFPCTDLSVAGKGEGMVNKCDACGHSWPIDFSKAEEALVCPECGSEISSSTRSGLLGQVQRLLAQAHKDNELPTILLMENVKNLVGKKFKAQFDAWVKYLDSIGYNTKWKILNSKHYGIPQNRERCFAISILKTEDNNTFQFPEQITLETRLKDILEKDVSEKYYLPDDRIEKIIN